MNLKLRSTDKLKPCPFCGSEDLDLCNTHTASYWIECQCCTAQVHGKSFGDKFPSELQTRRHHRSAADSAITKWNART